MKLSEKLRNCAEKYRAEAGAEKIGGNIVKEAECKGIAAGYIAANAMLCASGLEESASSASTNSASREMPSLENVKHSVFSGYIDKGRGVSTLKVITDTYNYIARHFGQ